MNAFTCHQPRVDAFSYGLPVHCMYSKCSLKRPDSWAVFPVHYRSIPRPSWGLPITSGNEQTNASSEDRPCLGNEAFTPSACAVDASTSELIMFPTQERLPAKTAAAIPTSIGHLVVSLPHTLDRTKGTTPPFRAPLSLRGPPTPAPQCIAASCLAVQPDGALFKLHQVVVGTPRPRRREPVPGPPLWRPCPEPCAWPSWSNPPLEYPIVDGLVCFGPKL